MARANEILWAASVKETALVGCQLSLSGGKWKWVNFPEAPGRRPTSTGSALLIGVIETCLVQVDLTMAFFRTSVGQ